VFSDRTKINVIVILIISIILIILPFPEKSAVSNFFSPVLLLPVNIGNKFLANVALLKANLMKYDERCNRLALENAVLAEKLNITLDSMRAEMVGYNLLPAQIVGRDLITMNHMIFVDKGTTANVRRQAPVVYLGCAIGKVVDVTGYRSTIATILSPGFRVSSKIKRSGVFCMMMATNEGLIANYIQKDGDVQIGDTLISSGMSDIIPAGIYLATVIRLEDGDDMFFKKVYLKSIIDINKLQNVYIIMSQIKPLEKKSKYDPFKGLAPKPPSIPPP